MSMKEIIPQSGGKDLIREYHCGKKITQFIELQKDQQYLWLMYQYNDIMYMSIHPVCVIQIRGEAACLVINHSDLIHVCYQSWLLLNEYMITTLRPRGCLGGEFYMKEPTWHWDNNSSYIFA